MPIPQQVTSRAEQVPRVIEVLSSAGFEVTTQLCYSGSVKRRPAPLYTITRGSEFKVSSVTAGLLCALAYCYELGQETGLPHRFFDDEA